jgi:hypothetical protein
MLNKCKNEQCDKPPILDKPDKPDDKPDKPR